MSLPSPAPDELGFLYAMFAYGYFGWTGLFNDIARPIATLPPCMSIEDQERWNTHIIENIQQLIAVAPDFQFPLNNSYLYNHMGEICGGRKVDAPADAADSAALACYVYLNCKEDDVLVGFKVLRVIEVYSYTRFYYVYAIIGERVVNGVATRCIVFRGTSNVLQVVADITAFPSYATLTIAGRQFDVDSHTGFYKCINDADNNYGKSAFDVIMDALEGLPAAPVEETHLLLTCELFIIVLTGTREWGQSGVFQIKNEMEIGHHRPLT